MDQNKTFHIFARQSKGKDSKVFSSKTNLHHVRYPTWRLQRAVKLSGDMALGLSMKYAYSDKARSTGFLV